MTTTAVELWAVHVEGPDDVLPARDREAAERLAAEINAGWAAYREVRPAVPGVSPELRAFVVRWPFPRDEHAARVELYEREPYQP